MKRLLLLLLFFYLIISSKFQVQAQTAPSVAWERTIGGSNYDIPSYIQQTADGGYIVGGYSASGISGDKTEVSKGNVDYWVLKLDANGNKQWDKAYGGNSSDLLYSIIQTKDGGFLLGGESLSGISGDRTHASRGYTDFWVIKIDALGNKLWDKVYGGTMYDYFRSMQPTPDGGFILGGDSQSGQSGEKSQGSRGGYDYWVVKLDENGNKQWDRTFGGIFAEFLRTILPTSDGGYLLGGDSRSTLSGDKSQGSKGDYDYWILKLNANGNKIWDKTLGGTSSERLSSIMLSPDSGYILSGHSYSGTSGDKSQPNLGPVYSADFWVVKIDNSGNLVWDKTIGGTGDDGYYSMQQVFTGKYSANSFVVSGDSNSPASGNKSQASVGNYDYWVVGLDANGNKIWDKTIGGFDIDRITSLAQTTDGGCTLAGWTQSGTGGDKSQASKGGQDFWIVKLNAPCSNLSANLKASCSGGSKALEVHFSGLQSNNSGVLPWTLTYTVNGVTQTTTGTSPTFTLAQNAAPGTVYTLVSIVSGTCSTNLNQKFTVQPIPSAPSVIPGKNCGIGKVTLSATGAPAGGSYAWYEAATGGTALQSDTSRTFITPVLNATTTFYVAAANNAGCEGPRIPVTATIHNLDVQARGNDSVCVTATPFQLSGGSPVGGSWSGAGVNASGVFTPADSLVGTQTLTYSITQNGCTFLANKKVTVLKPAALGPDVAACEGDEVTLQPANSSGAYLWNDGSTAPFLKVRQSGTYWLKLDQNNCISTDSIQVTFKACPKPFIPNVVTLNQDGKNDTFRPQNLPDGNWHLRIFSRWGTKVFESENYQYDWPQTNITNGTYYYLLQNSATGQRFKGWVEVTE